MCEIEKVNIMDTTEKIVVGILVAMFVLVSFNIYTVSGFKKDIKSPSPSPVPSISGKAVATGPDVIPKGIPQIYGNELGVSYDDVSAATSEKADATIRKLGTLDQQLSVTGSDLERYIAITRQISCEYCCGADSIITPDGKAACGCAHSYAMRGLAKYLLKNHGTEYSNDQILEELGKWKTLFFPGAITAKAQVLQSKGIELTYVNLASNKYRGIEQGATGSKMVGGC